MWDAVASYKGTMQKTGMLRKFMKQVPNKRCRMCRMRLFLEKVHAVRLLRTLQFESFTTVQRDGSIVANGGRKLERQLPTLIEGWAVCTPTFYGSQIVMRSWVCPRQGLVVSSCAYDTRKRWRRPFVTPLTEKKLLGPNIFVPQWDEDCKRMFQPGNATDLGLLGCLQMLGVTFQRSRVCYRNGDPTQVGNFFFRVLRRNGDSRAVSTAFLPFGQIIVALGNIACWGQCSDVTGLLKWCMTTRHGKLVEEAARAGCVRVVAQGLRCMSGAHRGGVVRRRKGGVGQKEAKAKEGR